ncbi:phosphohydrolase with GAF sensor [Candidatus Magnetoovum chiemensis]|nr:phosphohydrolase with GAF sensor [Candidatus Magnetoovum chiemensis]
MGVDLMYYRNYTDMCGNKGDVSCILKTALSDNIKDDLKDDVGIDNLVKTITCELDKYIQTETTLNKKLLKIGTALSSQMNIEALLEMIVVEGMNVTNADGGTLYIVTSNGHRLSFKILQNRSLNLQMGGTSRKEIKFPPLSIYGVGGERNEHLVSVYVALTGKTVNIADVYEVDGFDFRGTKEFDKKTGYRSKSMLVTPLRNHEREVVGVLQLINASDSNGQVIPFSTDYQHLIESLASQAAVAIDNTSLIKDLNDLQLAFIQAIASAIDEKSPYTGGHIRRVAEITLDIAMNLCKSNDVKWRDFSLTPDEINELKIAAWMHDIGKITTPEYVIDKSTKLETIYDRIEIVMSRFEILKRDIELDFLKKQRAIDDKSAIPQIEQEYKDKIAKIEQDAEFIKRSNIGGEFMSDEHIARINEIAKYKIKMNGSEVPILNDNEVRNLCIRKGTLTEKERDLIQNHVVLTIKMLSRLPWPKKLKRVCEFAGEHHEKLNGQGYPYGLTLEDLPIQSRVLAIADVFEALTAADRPYKEGKKISEVIKILGFMVKDNHIDGGILDFFIKSGLMRQYAQRELKPYQLDTFSYDGQTYDYRLE